MKIIRWKADCKRVLRSRDVKEFATKSDKELKGLKEGVSSGCKRCDKQQTLYAWQLTLTCSDPRSVVHSSNPQELIPIHASPPVVPFKSFFVPLLTLSWNSIIHYWNVSFQLYPGRPVSRFPNCLENYHLRRVFCIFDRLARVRRKGWLLNGSRL